MVWHPALVAEADLETLVEKSHHLEALDHCLGPELDLLEDGRVRPEGHGGAGPAARRLAGHLELAGRLAALGEFDLVVVAVAVDVQWSRTERALTTEIPTPWRPPDTL